MLIYYEFTFLDALCNHFTRCNYWTWNPHDSLCWLKTSDAGRKQKNGAFSGTKTCSDGKQPSPGKFKVSKNYW